MPRRARQIPVHFIKHFLKSKGQRTTVLCFFIKFFGKFNIIYFMPKLPLSAKYLKKLFVFCLDILPIIWYNTIVKIKRRISYELYIRKRYCKKLECF